MSGGSQKGVRKMGQRQTRTYLDTRAIYSEAEYLSAILLWLQGYSGPLGGVPKALIKRSVTRDSRRKRMGRGSYCAFFRARSEFV
jgi:hypothetical protein